MIHQYKMDDLQIVIDVNSGSIHLVDDLMYDIIERMEKGESSLDISIDLSSKYSNNEIDEAFNEINQLINSGQLFTEDTYDEVVDKFNDRETVVKALCLHIAHDCNLACKYCFAEEGEYHGERSMMSLDIGKKAIDFLIENSGNRRNLEVDFFGGEPLMNFNVVKEIVLYAKSKEEAYNKNFRFTLTTNGVLLNEEIMDFLNDNMHNIVLSIDGRKEIHDNMRPSQNGKGSYDLIIEKFKKLADMRGQKDYYVRGTFTRHNLDFSEDVLHLADLGFKQISVEPVVADENKAYAITKKDLPTLFNEYEKLTKKLIEYKKENKDFNFFHFMIDLNQGPCVIKRLTGCGSGSEYLAVSPKGELYPCHQFVGLEEFKMGSVDDGLINLNIQNQFKQCHVYSKEQCKTCWAKFYCSGGCHANSYNFHGDIHNIYEIGCELEKKRVECSIYLKAKELIS